MIEDTITFGSYNNLIGITCEPKQTNEKLPIILLLNAGIVFRVGPGRFYVELARELSNYGFTSCRFDFTGLGDSQKINNEDVVDVNTYRQDCIEAMNKLQAQYGTDSFIIFSFCGGGNVGLLTALVDSRIKHVISVNGLIKEKYFFENVFVPAARRRITQRYYKKKIFNGNSWMKLLSGKSGLLTRKALGRFMNNRKSANHTINVGVEEDIVDKHNPSIELLAQVEKHAIKVEEVEVHENSKATNLPTANELIEPYKKLKDRKVKMMFIYSEGSDIHEVYKMTLENEFKKILDSDTKLIYLKNIDHTFTLNWAKLKLCQLVVSWLKNYYEV